MMLPSIMSWPSMTIHDHQRRTAMDCFTTSGPQKSSYLDPGPPPADSWSSTFPSTFPSWCPTAAYSCKKWVNPGAAKRVEEVKSSPFCLNQQTDSSHARFWGGWSSGKSSKARLGLKKASRFSTSPSWPTASCGLSWQLSTAPFGNWAAGRGVRHNLNAVIKPHMALAVSPSGFSIFSSPRPPRFQDAFSLTSGNFVSLILGHWDFGWDVTAPTNRKCSSWSIISQDLESPWH